jgi:hypothetical protein
MTEVTDDKGSFNIIFSSIGMENLEKIDLLQMSG